MSTLKIVIKKDKINQKGEAPICLRITRDRKSKYVSLGYSVNPKLWDVNIGRVKRAHPNSVRLNSMLNNNITDATDFVLETETKNRHVNIDKIKRMVLGKGHESFLDYFSLYLEKEKKENRVATYKKGSAVKKKLEAYIGAKNLDFKDIDVSWLKQYAHYLKVNQKNSINTVHSNLKLFRKLFNDAMNEDLISAEIYPFNKYKIEWSKKQVKDYLEEDEINILRNLALIRNSRGDICRNMFVFSCYTGGIRISDLLLLRWSMFDGKHLNFTSYKTNDNLSIMVPTVGREILQIYHQGDFKSKFNDYVFPLMQGRPLDSQQEKHTSFSRVTAIFNKELKIVAAKAGLKNSQISSHWARRSFTCLALSKGMNLDVVSKILGHSGESVTLDSYAQYTDKHLHDAMSIFE